MDIDDLQGINFPGPLVNFKTQEYIYILVSVILLSTKKNLKILW